MKQLDLEDHIKEKKAQKEKKPNWVNSSYEPIRVGDLVKYPDSTDEKIKKIGLVLETIPSNVYDSARCKILESDGKKISIETSWVRKVI